MVRFCKLLYEMHDILVNAGISVVKAAQPNKQAAFTLTEALFLQELVRIKIRGWTALAYLLISGN